MRQCGSAVSQQSQNCSAVARLYLYWHSPMTSHSSPIRNIWPELQSPPICKLTFYHHSFIVLHVVLAAHTQQTMSELQSR